MTWATVPRVTNGYRANRATQDLITRAGGSMVFTRGVIIPVP